MKALPAHSPLEYKEGMPGRGSRSYHAKLRKEAEALLKAFSARYSVGSCVRYRRRGCKEEESGLLDARAYVIAVGELAVCRLVGGNVICLKSVVPKLVTENE